MGMWPFRRRNNPGTSHGAGAIPPLAEDTMRDAGTQRDPGRHHSPETASSEPERRRSRRDSQRKRKSSTDRKKLQRDPERRRTYSFSPGRNDNILISRDVNRPPVPPLPANMKGKAVRVDTQRPEASSAGKNPLRVSTQPPESAQDPQRVPTLHKRTAQDLARRKSSKKRKEEHDREAEIKAMVAFRPTRPAAEDHATGRLMKRESKRMHAGLNRNLENPSSDISLPLAESLRSTLSSKSENQAAYKLSAFDMLSPRPTIRYSENPRFTQGTTTGADGSHKSGSRKRKISERVPIPEETLKANKRIDDLADNLDAGELRELMERDQKRRERKKLATKIMVEQKVARRQEKQKDDEAAAARNGTPPPSNMERGVLGREVIGLGIGTSAVVTSSKRRASTASDRDRGKRPADAFREDSTTDALNRLRGASQASEQLEDGREYSDPATEISQAEGGGKANNFAPSLPRDHTPWASSKSPKKEPAKTGIVQAPPALVPRNSEPVRQSSENNSLPSQSWRSFFRRSKTTKRNSTPASFSNTTRGSIQNGQVHAPQIGYTPVWATSNIPKRTRSKFREDLPELPISPPDSRVQSLEADVVPPIRTDYPDKKSSNRASSDDPRVRYDTPTSGYRSLDTTRLRDETPTSGHRSVDAPSPEPTVVFSQSLASIDSEGSWLSGRKGGSKRGSAQLAAHPLRESTSSLQQRYKDDSDSADELGIGDDEYFTRLTPGPEAQRKFRRQSAGNPMPSSDEEDGSSLASPIPSEHSKWGAVVRHPTVVHHGSNAKSREGLMNDYVIDSNSEQAGETPSDLNRMSFGFNHELIEEDEPSVHRASSVDLGRGHARRISAGSARLLDVKPRASVDGKRTIIGEEGVERLVSRCISGESTTDTI